MILFDKKFVYTLIGLKILKYVLSPEPITFTVDELQKIQSSDDPFTKEELLEIFNTEMEKPREETDYDLINYCRQELFGM